MSGLRLLVVGGGGREHAMVWALAHSPCAGRIFCCPGNAGVAELAECVHVPGGVGALCTWAEENRIDFTLVGPEVPLAEGIVDLFDRRGLLVLGPSRQAAELETSKSFAKELMLKHNIPTGAAASFTDIEEALSYLHQSPLPVVVKADGLAAGKGVTVASTREEGQLAVLGAMREGIFGEAGRKILIEEYLHGEEASVIAFTDGDTVVPMEPAQDHKRAFDGDRGPNTGGMGALSPTPAVDGPARQLVTQQILIPLVRAMKEEGRPYKGILYAGLMMTEAGPKVVEWNCRLGDPEAQVLLPRLASDFLEVSLAAATGRLSDVSVAFRQEACACVVVASGGYPGEYKGGYPILGLQEAGSIPGVLVFHAATKRQNARIVTAGGRVLGVSALGSTMGDAVGSAYDAVRELHFEDMQYRTDIGRKALARKTSAGPAL